MYLQQAIEEEGGRWSDFTSFEGNANAIRLLMHQFLGRRKGGFAMTYATLASIVKYPYSSALSGGKNKFGFFASEETDYRRIADDLGIVRLQDDPLKYVRYPLVYLVEAADDICYQVMDIEDAHKLHLIILKKQGTAARFFFPESLSVVNKTLTMVTDVNEQIAYLRSGVIGLLVDECSKVFLANEESILSGSFTGSLIDCISPVSSNAYLACSLFARQHITAPGMYWMWSWQATGLLVFCLKSSPKRYRIRACLLGIAAEQDSRTV